MRKTTRLAVSAVVTAILFGAALPAAAAPGPPGHGEWWFDTWHVQRLWDEGANGHGITIGVIDTGVNANLPELSGSVLPGTDLGSDGGDGRIDRDTDPFGHGTGMASLMVAHAGQADILGIAPDAKVLPVAVPITGTTDDAGDAANGFLLQAIRWAADHGAKIINMSLGAPRDDSNVVRSCPPDEQSAIDYALRKGAIVVASGGNSGSDGSPIEEPSVCLGVVSVGAVDSTGAVAAFSSRHPYLTVTAPGVNVPTLGRVPGQAFYGDGTSQAAAITSGGLALIWSKYPSLTSSQVVARLLATVDGRHAIRDPATGYGSVDIGGAVDRFVPDDAPDPVFDAVRPFLDHDEQADMPTPAAPRAGPRKTLRGTVTVTKPPGVLAAGEGLGGLVTGVAGLVVLLVLLITRIRRAPG